MDWLTVQCSWTTTLGQEQEAVQTIPWPTMSPDMNHIEHVWNFIGRKINKRNPKCQTIDELRTDILQEWQQFPHGRLRCLVRSMTRRITELLNKRVGYSRYWLYALHIRTIDVFKHLKLQSKTNWFYVFPAPVLNPIFATSSSRLLGWWIRRRLVIMLKTLV